MAYPTLFLHFNTIPMNDDIQAIKDQIDLVDEIQADGTRLQASGKNHWMGLCPFHPNTKTPALCVFVDTQSYFCFSCHAAGDIFTWMNKRHGVPFIDALAQLAARTGIPLDAGRSYQPAPPSPPQDAVAPPAPWRKTATAYAKQAMTDLWGGGTFARQCRDYLHGRGLSEATIRAARLGCIPHAISDNGQAWGQATASGVWLPQGITFPYFVDGAVWRLNIRRLLTPAQVADKQPKYLGPAGWGDASPLYNQHRLRPGCIAVLCEGELDALSVQQAVGDAVVAVATGATSGARRLRWIDQLMACSLVLVAFDGDCIQDAATGIPTYPGDAAALWWEAALGDRAMRLRPVGGKDCNEMLTNLANMHDWALGSARLWRLTAHAASVRRSMRLLTKRDLAHPLLEKRTAQLAHIRDVCRMEGQV